VADRAVARETLRLLNYRSRNIVRTEISRAWNEGMAESIRAGLESGDIVGDLVVQRWWTATDERVCDVCGPLHGQTAALGEEFEGGIAAPPVHPSCRCVVSAVVLDADEARAYREGGVN